MLGHPAHHTLDYVWVPLQHLPVRARPVLRGQARDIRGLRLRAVQSRAEATQMIAALIGVRWRTNASEKSEAFLF
jgi:hypothetical protein